MGGGFSVAWRLHDAQHHGVPQRRRRLCVLADFNGDSAPRMVFELLRKTVVEEAEQIVGDIGTESRSEIQSQSESLSRNTQTSGEEGKRIATDTQGNAHTAISFLERSGKPGGGKGILIQNEKTGTLSTLNNQSVVQGINGNVSAPIDASYYKGYGERAGIEREVVCYGISGMDSNAMKSPNPYSGIYEADTTRTLDLNGGSPACNQGGMIVLEGNGYRDSHKGDGFKKSETMYTLNTVEQHAVCVSQDAYDKFSINDQCASLRASGGTYGGGSEALVIQ